MNYTHSQKILERYADVLINFALNSGRGIKKGEVIFLRIPESAKPFYVVLRNAVLKAGGTYITAYLPEGTAREHYELASPEQLSFFHHHYHKGLIKQIDHFVSIIADVDPRELEGVDPKKFMLASKSYKPAWKWMDEKEHNGRFTWTAALYATPAMAKEAGLSLREYWNQIIKSCFLDKQNPIGEGKKIFSKNEVTQKKLNALPIESLHIVGDDDALTVGIGKGRRWLTGMGRNIPSFEIFISPDWRGTNGFISFKQPVYRYGTLIEGVSLWFKNGEVIKVKARKGEKLLKEMIATDKGSNKVGEFSLTDARFSRITKFMAETLFDENVCGKYGNTHIALGNAYHDCLADDPSTLEPEDWEELGFNSSSVHTDIVSTTPRTVTAYMRDGREQIIYKDGLSTFI